ncbi:ARM repeat superfamily protein isoform X2 [Wolffia australiana]
MAPGDRAISQQAFEDMVRENMEDLGMDSQEALEDAIEALTLQGVDLSGIIKCVPGVSTANDDPVIQILDALQEISDAGSVHGSRVGETIQLLGRLIDLCSSEGAGNASIAARNGAVELLCGLCSSFIENGENAALESVLRALSVVIGDIRSSEIFQKNDGPKLIVKILNKCDQTSNLMEIGFSVVAAAAAGNEIVKEAFVDLKIGDLFLKTLSKSSKYSGETMYDAICVILTPDDDRVVASQVYGYARKFAKMGISDSLVSSLKEAQCSSSFISKCFFALKAVAVNDEICMSISESGGIDVILQCIVESIEQNNKTIAKSSCSLLAKLAGSDSNKNIIVQNGGLDSLIRLSSRFSNHPSVLQEVMGVITVLSLRSPENAARAIEAGAGDMAIRAMNKFPTAYQMQKQSCQMIRNLVVRNPENRTFLLSKGIERLIRKVKYSSETCKDAASAALRDLGLDDYN